LQNLTKCPKQHLVIRRFHWEWRSILEVEQIQKIKGRTVIMAFPHQFRAVAQRSIDCRVSVLLEVQRSGTSPYTFGLCTFVSKEHLFIVIGE
jgi:hypothetical protein